MQENARHPDRTLPPCAGGPRRRQLVDPTREATKERASGRRLCHPALSHRRCSGFPVGGAASGARPARVQASSWPCRRRQTERGARVAASPALQVRAASREGITGPSPLIPGCCIAKNIGETEVYSLDPDVVK